MSVITQENIQLLVSVCTLLGIVFAVYKTFRDPDVKANEKIKLINQRG